MVKILNQFGHEISSRKPIQDFYKRLKNRYDAAQDHVENENHWLNADNLSPHASAGIGIRQKLRSRSRYEVIENNAYLKGNIITIANDFVGTGPNLNIIDKRIPKELKKHNENIGSILNIKKKKKHNKNVIFNIEQNVIIEFDNGK